MVAPRCRTRSAARRPSAERSSVASPRCCARPYGNGGYVTTAKKTRKAIDATASACGIQHVVMWNAVAENGSFQVHPGITKRGDIVLFHFTPNLAGELKTVMRMAAKTGLHPAPLTNYLK